LRKAFLGEELSKNPQANEIEQQFNHVRENLQASVSRQRTHKNLKFAQLDAALDATADVPESRLSSGWEQNSFVTPLDSRNADL
ncbi:MAG: hypothetical protein CFE44_25065, partial [Burkholderiales bacterium PBB4]